MGRRFWNVVVLVAVLTALFIVPAGARVRTATDMLPDGDTPPIVVSAELLAPQEHNALLEADLVIDATDNDAISRYEYRWNSSVLGSIHITDTEHPRVDYRPTMPETAYALELRAVDVHSNASEWYPVWSGTTPSVPNVIVAGDSIASGYSRQWFTADSKCTDRELSYGSTLVAGVARHLPEAWAPEYHNIAWAGAGINSMLSGGADSCGVHHDAQVARIASLADAASWNVVVVTSGINSTNWTDVIVGLTRDTAISFSRAGDQRACDLALHDKWNIGQRTAAIQDGTRRTTERLTTETNASIFWTGYYDIVGSQIAPLWSPIGSECSTEMAEAMDQLHGALKGGLSSDVTWVAIDRDVATQTWAGWPHPNAEGHAAIGEAISGAVLPQLLTGV